MKEAAIEAKQGGERGITARSVKKVTAVSATDWMPVPDLVAHATLPQDSLAKFRG